MRRRLLARRLKLTNFRNHRPVLKISKIPVVGMSEGTGLPSLGSLMGPRRPALNAEEIMAQFGGFVS